MKGVINKGMQDFVECRFGAGAWEQILGEVGCDEVSFAPSLDYADQLTMDLVRATAERTQFTADEVLVEYGKHWIQHTGPSTYPTLFALAGVSPRGFLSRMGRVHLQATQSIPGARPPTLVTEDSPDGGLAIHYTSERKLCPAVRGLILGVGVRFQTELKVSETRCGRPGAGPCTFEVRFP